MPRTTILRRLVDATRPAPATTLRRHLLTRTRAVVVSFTLFAAAYVGGLAATGSTHGVGDMDMVPPEQGAVAITDEQRAAERVGRLFDRHECWDGVAPADVEIPGGVVMTRDGGSPRFYGSDHALTIAFEQVLGAVRGDRIVTVDHGVTVHGFCR
jgi:hypothetical protein